jgi:ATP-dependent DNA ligase
MVAKDNASPYRSGRTLSWLKVKQQRYQDGERNYEPTSKS